MNRIAIQNTGGSWTVSPWPIAPRSIRWKNRRAGKHKKSLQESNRWLSTNYENALKIAEANALRIAGQPKL